MIHFVACTVCDGRDAAAVRAILEETLLSGAAGAVLPVVGCLLAVGLLRFLPLGLRGSEKTEGGDQ